MAWTRIMGKLHEGQFIRLKENFRKSSFSKENSVTDASYSIKHGALFNYSREDAFINKDSIGKISSPYNLNDGSYLVKFGYGLMDKGTGKTLGIFLLRAGSMVKIEDEGLFYIAEVWID